MHTTPKTIKKNQAESYSIVACFEPSVDGNHTDGKENLDSRFGASRSSDSNSYDISYADADTDLSMEFVFESDTLELFIAETLKVCNARNVNKGILFFHDLYIGDEHATFLQIAIQTVKRLFRLRRR